MSQHGAGTPPAMPEPVRAVFDRFPEPARATLLAVRRLIFETATLHDAGPLTETLKWGEPAYLTEVTRSGSTVRLGVPRGAPAHCAVYVNCRTALVDTFRSMVPDEMAFVGNRAILLPEAGPVPEAPLVACLAVALTWHRCRDTVPPSQRIGANRRATGAP